MQESSVADGVAVRRIECDGATGRVPGLLYTPDGDAARPLILLGHGGGQGKDNPRFAALCHRIAAGADATVLAIDGPVHGERRPPGTVEESFLAGRLALVDPQTPVRFTEDWRAAIEAARTLVDVDAIGYCGFSMGVLLGVPVVAGLGCVRAAVFGVGGVPAPGGIGHVVRQVLGNQDAAAAIDDLDDAGLRGRIVLEAAARLTSTEVFMINTIDDVAFPPSNALELFAAFPGPKRIAFWPGSHVELGPEAIALASGFLRRVLRGERPW